MSHFPQHSGAVLLIERIVRVNEEKLPVLLLGILMPQEPHQVNKSLNPGFQPPTELLRPTGLLGLFPHHRLCQVSPTPTGQTPGAIFKADVAPRHQCPVGYSGGGESVGHLVPKLPNNMP